jgi:hypothetical protein
MSSTGMVLWYYGIGYWVNGRTKIETPRSKIQEPKKENEKKESRKITPSQYHIPNTLYQIKALQLGSTTTP